VPRFNKIKGLSEERRLPRLGKIRLGIKKKSQRTGAEYPAEIDYFRFDKEIEADALKRLGFDGEEEGSRPQDLKKLDVMLPAEEVENVMPVAYKYYKATGLWCTGNGEQAIRRGDNGQLDDTIECPCPFLEQNKCRRMAVINVVVPKLSMGGVFQITTGSWNSIVDFQSGMDYVRQLIGRCSWVPLVLERVPNKMQHTDKDGKSSMQTHYTLRLVLDQEADADFINRLKAETGRILTGPRYILPTPEVTPALDVMDAGATDLAALPAPPPDDDDNVRDADFTVPGEGDDKETQSPQEDDQESGEEAARGKSPSSSGSDQKPPAKPKKPRKPAKGKSLGEVSGLWKKVKSIFGDKAEQFWRFVITEYFGAETSSDVHASKAKDVIARIDKIAAIEDASTREGEGEGLWQDLTIEADERAAATAGG
jgi:hypothetical protein